MTDEAEEAIEIAEWIGAKVEGNHWRFKGKKWDSAESIVDSDSGEVAMMDKLISELWCFNCGRNADDEKLIDFGLLPLSVYFRKKEHNYIGTAPTRNAALRCAITKMLKGKK